MPQGQRPTINKGQKLSYTSTPFLGKKRVNNVIGLYNALTNCEVKVVSNVGNTGTDPSALNNIKPDLTFDADKAILTIPFTTQSSSGTNLPGWFWTAGQRNYVPGTSYVEQQVVYVSPDSTAATTGLMDAGSLSLQKAVPGTYVCLQANSGTIIGGTPYYNVPRIPYPTPGNPDDTANFWWMVTPDIQCI